MLMKFMNLFNEVQISTADIRSNAWELYSSKACESAVDLSPAHETAMVEATGIDGR